MVLRLVIFFFCFSLGLIRTIVKRLDMLLKNMKAKNQTRLRLAVKTYSCIRGGCIDLRQKRCQAYARVREPVNKKQSNKNDIARVDPVNYERCSYPVKRPRPTRPCRCKTTSMPSMFESLGIDSPAMLYLSCAHTRPGRCQLRWNNFGRSK